MRIEKEMEKSEEISWYLKRKREENELKGVESLVMIVSISCWIRSEHYGFIKDYDTYMKVPSSLCDARLPCKREINLSANNPCFITFLINFVYFFALKKTKTTVETFAIFMLSFSNKCINIIHRNIRVIDS